MGIKEIVKEKATQWMENMEQMAASRELTLPGHLPPAFEEPEADAPEMDKKPFLRDRYLMDERALLILPTLACVFGVQEAIILQQVHYFTAIKRERNELDYYYKGSYWTYATYSDWQKQLPYFSLATIKRALAHLVSSGVLYKVTSRRGGATVTLYAINYKKLADTINAYDFAPHQIKAELLCKVYYDEDCNAILHQPNKKSKPKKYVVTQINSQNK